MPLPQVLTVVLAVVGISLIVADESRDSASPVAEVLTESRGSDREASVKALQELGILIGDWKGVAQPKRGSSAGAWSEKAHAVWNFDDKTTALVVQFEPGQLFHSATFTLAEDGKTTSLTLEPVMGKPILLSRNGAEDDKESSDEARHFESVADKFPRTRCTVRLISDIRVTFLFEEKSAEMGSYRRLCEVGMTRLGTRLADGNTGERQCIVTGGLGTMKVSYEGKTYYVCCEGCKQAFDADPEGTLAAYQERLKAAAGKSP